MKYEIIVESKYVVLSHDAFVNRETFLKINRDSSHFFGLSACLEDAHVTQLQSP